MSALLGLVALATRLAYWWSTAGNPLRSDAGQYHEIATNLAHGDGFAHQFPQLELHPTAFRPPVLPAVLSAVYRVTGAHPGVARGFAVVLGVILVVVVHRVVRRHLPAPAAVATAALVAVYPPLIANDTVPLTETLSLVVLVVLADRIVERRWAWAGVLCGLLVLTRPSAQGLVVVVALWLWRTIGWRRALGAAIVTACVVAPWVARNRVEVGTPAIVTSNGFNLAALYSPQAQATGAFVDPVHHPGFADLRFAQFDEAVWNDELGQLAVSNLRRHPWLVAKVVGRNTLAILELKPSLNERAEEADNRNLAVRSLTLPLFYVVTVVGVVGLWRERRNPYVAFVALTAAYFLVTSLFLVAPPRLRAPLDLACCLGTGIVLASWWTKRLPVSAGTGPGAAGGSSR